jgi:hypothetical protein
MKWWLAAVVAVSALTFHLRGLFSLRAVRTEWPVGNLSELTVPGASRAPVFEYNPPKSQTKNSVDRLFADAVLSSRGPRVFRKSPLSFLAVPKVLDWSPGGLAEVYRGKVVLVHESKEAETRLHAQAAPMAAVPGVDWARPWRMVNATVDEVFDVRDERHLAWMTTLSEEDQPEQVREVVRMLRLRASPKNAEPNVVMEVNRWVSRPGSTTPLHYDCVDNLYLQLHGAKRFVLVPPRVMADGARLYPKVHPSNRQARVVPRAGGVLEALLRPGDLLFIPAYWGHRVTAETVSVSLSFHVEAKSVDPRDRMNQAPLPLEAGEERHRVVAFTEYIHLLAPPAAVAALLDERWAHLDTDAEARGLVAALDAAEAAWRWGGRDRAYLPVIAPQLKEKVEAKAAAMREILSRFDDEVRAIELGNYIEDLAVACVGPALARTFLKHVAGRKVGV